MDPEFEVPPQTEALKQDLSSSLSAAQAPGSAEGKALSGRLASLFSVKSARPEHAGALAELAEARLRQFSLFSANDYWQMHPDVKAVGVAAEVHFAQSGALEGRQAFSEAALLKRLSHLPLPTTSAPLTQLKPEPASEGEPAEGVRVAPSSVVLLLSSQASPHTRALAKGLREDLQRQGITVTQGDQDTAREALDPEGCIVLAPHEFFVEGQDPAWLTTDFVTRCTVFNTVRLSSRQFVKAFIPLLLAERVMDLCPQSTRVWQDTGRTAMHYEPRARWGEQEALTPADWQHPLLEALPLEAREFQDGPWCSRPLDIGFTGHWSERRAHWLGSYAARFASHPAFIYLARACSVDVGSHEGFSKEERAAASLNHALALARIVPQVARRTKVWLNLHYDEVPSFVWRRMVQQGMASGSLLISESCLPHPVFQPGEHFLQENARHLPNLVEWVLKTPDGQQEANRILQNVRQLLDANDLAPLQSEQLLHFLSKGRS